jgi:hypothetical protein
MGLQPTTTVSSSSSSLTTDATNDGNSGRNVVVASVAETTLQSADILQHILSFVGENQHRFISTIYKTFNAAYLQL